MNVDWRSWGKEELKLKFIKRKNRKKHNCKSSLQVSDDHNKTVEN